MSDLSIHLKLDAKKEAWYFTFFQLRQTIGSKSLISHKGEINQLISLPYKKEQLISLPFLISFLKPNLVIATHFCAAFIRTTDQIREENLYSVRG